MFRGKKKIEVNNEELRIIRIALVDFRNRLLAENKYADVVNETIIKLKNKMKVDKYELNIIIQGVFEKEQSMKANNEDTSIIDDLLLNLINVSESMSKS